MTRLRLVGPVDAIAIEVPGPNLGQIAVENLVGILRQLDPVDLPVRRAVEQAELHLRRMGGEKREIGALSIPTAPRGCGKPSFIREFTIDAKIYSLR